MTTRWDYNPSSDNNNASIPGSPARKKLELKPRSVNMNLGASGATRPRRSSRRTNSSHGDPFGAARPREEVLAQKGIDARLMDMRIDKKTKLKRFTKEQEIELEGVRDELTKVEAALRDANERELPEEKFRVQAEQKRKELNEMMARFAKENEKTEQQSMGKRRNSAGNGRHGNQDTCTKQRWNHGNNSAEDVYASFSSVRRRQGRDEHPQD